MMTVKTDVEEFKRFNELLKVNYPQYEPHWLILNKNGKDPIPRKWKPSKKNPNYETITFEKACKWMQKGHNIGIAGTNKDGLVIIDVDDREGFTGHEFVSTLKCRSSSRIGDHYFYSTSDPRCKVNIPLDEIGEMRTNWQYVVCAGSYVDIIDSVDKDGNITQTKEDKIKEIPENDRVNAGKYTIENSIGMSNITFEDIPEQFTKAKEQRDQEDKEIEKKKTNTVRTTANDNNKSALFDLTIDDVVNSAGKSERFASVFHGSHTGKNTAIKDGLLHCFRCNVYHTPITALAALSGMYSCVDAGTAHQSSGAGLSQVDLDDGETVFKIWEYAKDNGYISKNDKTPAKALVYYAISNGICNESDVIEGWKLPSGAYKTALNLLNGVIEKDSIEPLNESDAFFKVINDRVSAEYSLDGIAWGIKLTIDGIKVNQATKSRRRFDDNLETRNRQLKDALKIMSKRKGGEFNNDELNEIVFNIMDVGASLVKQLIDAKAKNAEIKDNEADDIEEDLFEDPLEMLIADDIKAKAKEKAIQIMKEGDPIKEVIRIIETIHIGDKKITEALCLGLASQSCLNTQGIQPSAIGGSGSGKSHNIKTFVHTIRPKHVMETSLTPKALYYTDVKPGTIIFSDDVGMDEEMETIIKRATTNYQDITKHTTVVKQEGKEMSIPPRIMWMFTSVDNEGSEQLLNRQLTLNTDESKDHKTGIFNKQVEEAQTGEMGIMEVTEDILIAREIHDIIKSKMFNVVIPFANKIKIADKTNSRNFPLFLDMLKGFTIYKHMQRESNEKGYILANKEDFKCAKIMFENQKENIITKLSDEERKVLRAIGDRKLGATINEIATATKLSYQKIRNLIEGRKETNKAGLIDRIVELRIFDDSESVKETEEVTQHRRNKRYMMINYDPISLFEGEFITLDD